MKARELLAEYGFLSKMTSDSDLDDLVRHGIQQRVIDQIRPAVAKIVVHENGELYTPDRGGWHRRCGSRRCNCRRAFEEVPPITIEYER
jgi:hypothetical protein